MRHMRKLALIALIVAGLEIATFILIGKEIGVIAVFIIIFATAFIGVHLAKTHARTTFIEAQQQMAQGQMPQKQIVDGLCILIGGILLIVPGFITDLVGLLLLIPSTRTFFQRKLYDVLRRRMNAQTIIYRK